LIKNGHVVRGYLGVRYMPDDVSDDVKDELALDTDEGALVYEVEAGSPAQTAGLKPYDFITSVDGHHISGPASLRLVIAQVPIGKEVGLIYIRDGHSNSTTVKIGMLPSDLISSTDGAPPHNPESTNSPTEPEPANGSNTKATVVTGIKVGDLSPKNRATFKVDPKVKTAGAIVTDVSDGSLAELMDLKPGDIIVNARVSHSPGKEISSADDFNKLAKDIKPGQSVLLLVTRGVESGGLINLSASKMNP
jgi:serine protease Do